VRRGAMIAILCVWGSACAPLTWQQESFNSVSWRLHWRCVYGSYQAVGFLLLVGVIQSVCGVGTVHAPGIASHLVLVLAREGAGVVDA
jgi:hypothetical protein